MQTQDLKTLRRKLKNQADEVTRLTKAVQERNQSIKTLREKNRKLVLQKEKLWKRENEAKELLKRKLSAAEREALKSCAQEGDKSEAMRYQLYVANDEKQSLSDAYDKLCAQHKKLTSTFEAQRSRLAASEEQVASLKRQLLRRGITPPGMTPPPPAQANTAEKLHELVCQLAHERQRNSMLQTQMGKAVKRADVLSSELKTFKLIKGKRVEDIPEFHPRTSQTVSVPGFPVPVPVVTSQSLLQVAGAPAPVTVLPVPPVAASRSAPPSSRGLRPTSAGAPEPAVLPMSRSPVKSPTDSLPAPIHELNKGSSFKAERICSKSSVPVPSGAAKTIGSPQKPPCSTPANASLLSTGDSIWSDSKGWAPSAPKQKWATGPPDSSSPLMRSLTSSAEINVITPSCSPAKSPVQRRSEPKKQPPPLVQVQGTPAKVPERSGNSWEAPQVPFKNKATRKLSKGFVKVQDASWSKPTGGWSDSWG